jgi:dTDP-4-amino-4,6-dideoxygalactose transaminase
MAHQEIAQVWLSGNGTFTQQCQADLAKRIGCDQVLLNHFCTAGLEMAEIQPEDEVIMPSYTFVSTANA